MTFCSIGAALLSLSIAASQRFIMKNA